ncbi:hypothetical protein Tco_0459967 [Tanacetum coccineum]
MQSGHLEELRSNLRDIDKELDQGGTNEVILQRRLEILKNLHDINSANARDYMQKAKIQWAIEGDENSKFFHGIINRKRANLAIKGVMGGGDRDLGDDPCPRMATLESPVSRDEVRNAVWGCGENKFAGPLMGSRLNFSQNSGYQILDGPFIINELLSWCKHKKQQAMVFKVDFAKAYDSIRFSSYSGECHRSKPFWVFPYSPLLFLLSGSFDSTLKRVILLGVEAWEDTIGKLKARLSNWKLKPQR